MAFLVIAGTTYQVLTEGATEDAPEVGGLLLEWAWDNTPQVTTAPVRRVRNFTLQPILESVEQGLRDDVADGPVAVSGDAMGAGGETQCLVFVTSSEYRDDGVLGFYRIPTIRVVQGEA